MGFFGDLFGFGRPASSPRASLLDSGGTVISTPQQLEEALRTGNVSESGEHVSPERALSISAAYGCVRLISGAIATVPLHIKRRIDERTREDASDHPVSTLVRRRPNRWQKPHQFKRMMQANILLRGNGYALKVPGVRGPQELIPLHPDRVRPRQRDDWGVEYEWTRKNGSRVVFQQEQILHLYGLTLDGFTGVTPLTFARETIGTALSMDRYVSRTMRKGARVSGAMQKKEGALSDTAYDRLKESLEEYRSGGDEEGSFLLLEEGLEWKPMSLTIADMAWIEAKKLSRSEVCMFYGVPPSMIGDNSGSDSNWGTGLEQKSNGFQAFGLEDHYTMWEEGITCDLLTDPHYARFNRSALVRSDIKARWGSHVQALQWGVMSPNEVRALEDMNPRDDGDIYYPPPNTSGDAGSKDSENDDDVPPAR
ncbi:phage portal protein [Novosphingobium album (ex Liu et al. 2023)]|uniref:Phage portal protein n=1 Tax=Novosphingobium album (ex Liu et al. 2023) TaxID=3031130 RepID=A0ABT5WXX4_9SPHN|nr:phage portal protein [Novosphingobium album (ex Liu et al. 2023)]MDE8654780.1 phage portal protein [Novosphingobium album (ex Liu et al. 2023)]